MQETYEVKHPRNYKRKPARGEEKANQDLFKKASAIMEKLLSDPKQYEYWQQRFEAQLYATRGSKADPYATYDPKRGTKRRYVRFDAFVRTMIMQELKQKARKSWFHNFFYRKIWLCQKKAVILRTFSVLYASTRALCARNGEQPR